MVYKKTIAIIACDHGYGHVRRALILSNALAKNSWTVYLFAPKAAVNKLMSNYGLNRGVVTINFNSVTTMDSLRNGKAINWYKYLPSMNYYDLVLCDNLVEILEVRSDAILSGSFLWHFVSEDLDSDIVARAEILLKTYKPIMIASSLFASKELYKITKLKSVGLFVSELPPANIERGKDLLVSCGMSNELVEDFRKLVDNLAKGPKPPFNTVWIEPRLMPPTVPVWMKTAKFNSFMLTSLNAAICRPGVGTLTDCLWGGARVFCCYEKGNKEMKDNAIAINNAGVGEYFSSPEGAFYNAKCYVQDDEKIKKHYASLKQLDFNGTPKAVSIIQEIYTKKFGT